MKLNFLGNSYSTRSAVIETSELNVSGTYRGQSVLFSSARPTSTDSAVVLRYRGVGYIR